MKKLYSTLFFAFASLLQTYAQIPNANFENWSINTYGIDEPSDWTSYNYGAATAAQYQPAQNGSFAVKLTNDTSQGFMLPGSIECYFPISTRPASLDGFYLGQFASQDLLIATIYLYDNAQNPIGAGSANITTSVGTYTSFSIPISYSAATQPDSAMIVIYLEPHDPTNLSGYVVIDNLTLNGAIGLNDKDKEKNLKLWPNPANDYLNVSISDLTSGSFTTEVFDLSGRIVGAAMEWNTTSEKNNFQLNTQSLSNGMYILNIKLKENSIKTTFVVNR